MGSLTKFKGRAYAKMNLFLHIGEKQASGLHEIFALNVFVSLCDTLVYQPYRSRPPVKAAHFRSSLSISGMPPQISTDEQNSMNKVFDVFAKQKENTAQTFCGHMHIKKRIPSQAGLGGGSSDAAIALHLLAKCYDQNLQHTLIKNCAASIGSDLYTCLQQQTNFMQGYGENITSVAPHTSRSLLAKTAVIILTPRRPKARLSTAKMYQRLTQKATTTKRKRLIPRYFNTEKPKRIGQNRQHFFWRLQHCHRNDFTPIAIDHVPSVGIALNALNHATPQKPLLARMSGSGSSCFAIFPSYAHAKKAQNNIMHSSYVKHFFFTAYRKNHLLLKIWLTCYMVLVIYRIRM